MRPSPKVLALTLLLPALFGFDFWTKDQARTLELGERVPVVDTSWLTLQWLHAENPDVAFSLPVPFALIVVFGVAAIGIMAHHLYTMRSDSWFMAGSVSMLLAGALGNLVDRLADGTVTDFAAVSTRHPTLAPWLLDTFHTTMWPIFNVADMLLVAGVIGYGLASWLHTEDDAMTATA